MGTWQAVAECARGRGKSRSVKPLLAAALLVLAGAGQSQAAGILPTGGSVVAGSGNISQSGNAMTINQASNRLAIDWQSFSVGAGNTVNFVQPGASAVALNRVLGADVSSIQGAIKANGQVFLINPNGLLFSPTSQVDVGSLVASTLNMRTADFMAGHYTFEGASSNAVVNQGNITAVGDGAKGGTIALIAARVSNDGALSANGGNVLMAAGGNVTLDLGGPVKLEVSQGALNAQVDNGGGVRADGGLVYLTAKAVNELTSATVNNTGAIRAQTLASGAKGELRLIADMQHGVLNVGGSLDASAPKGGDGGLIETSGARVNTLPDLAINAGAAAGRGGEWLIDPYDYTIGASQAATIVSSLNNGTSVTVSTVAPGGLSGYTAPSGSGDITVNSAIAKTAGGDATLTLRADRNIAVNQSITSTSGALGLTLSAANNASGALGGVRVASGVTLDSNGGKILIGGAGGSLADAQTLSNGIGYALNASASLEAVSIGSSARVLSRGGDITINGYSTQPKAGSNDTTGVRIGASAIIDSGYYAPGAVDAASGGYINISGKYAGPASTVFGVKIENPSGNSGQTTLSASTTTGSIRIEGSSTYDVDGSYALNMATGGLAGNIYFNAYSVADLIFILNGGLKGVVFTYSGPNSGCRSGYPNCGLLSVTSSANNSYLYATYNAVNMATRPIYVSATLTGTKVYDGTLNASGLSFSNIAILDPASSGYLSSSVTSASYVTPSANVGEYSNLSASSLSRNYSANGNNYVVGYNFTVSPSYAIMPATAYLSAVKTYDGNASFTPAKVTASGVNGETLSLTGSGPATANSPDVVDNATNYLTAIGDLMLANGVSGTQGLASNYVLPSLAARSAHNIASITPVGLTVLGVGGSKNYDGTASFSAGQLSLGSGVVDGDIVQLAGSAAVASKDIGAYTQWASSNLSLTGSGASNYTLIGGAVSALINPAPLGIAVNAIYNGTTSFTHGSGATLTTAGLIGAETVTGVTVSDANVDAVTAAKFVTGVTGGNGFVASNYVLYGAGTPAYNQSLSGGNITTSNNTSSIAPAPLGIAAAPTYNGTTAFATTAGVASGGTGSLVTGGSVSVAGLVNGHTLAGFSLDSANVASAGKVTDVTLGGGIDARNYVLNGSVFGSAASVSAGALADGSAATNVASLAAAPLGIAVNATYNGTTSFTHGSGAILTTAGLIGAETVTGVTVSDANVDAVTAAKFVTSVTGSNGFLASNYVLYGAGTPAYNQSLSGGSITTSNNTASLTPAPLGVAVSGAYNGSTVLSSAEGATIAGYGLVGQDAGVSLTTATLNAKNVSEASKVVALTGTGSFDQRNYVLNGAVNTAPGTAGVVLDGSGATNTAALSRAALGVAVSGTYNGSTSFDSTNATLTTNGLVGGDTLIGVTVNDANVVGNGGNYITAFTGGTASLSNYRISGSIDTTTTGAGISTTHNSVTLRRAPLGVAVSGTYNGSTSFVQGLNGTTIAAYGLVGQDVNVQLTSATLASRNAGTNRVVSIAGPAGFEPANYVLDGSVNTTPATAGTASDGSGATNAATIGARALTLVAEDKAKTFGQPDPEFTYQVSSGALLAGDALLGQVARRAGENLGAYPISAVGLANGNYAITAIDGTLTIVAPVEPPPPPTPIIVPAFIDNGMSALSSGVVPATFGGLNYVPASGGQAGAQGVGPRAPGNAGSEPAATPRSALNFVASSSAEASPAAASGATNGQTGNGPTAERRAPTDAGSEQAPAARSSLNFVADSSTEGAPEAAAGGTRKAARELNVNNVTVPSSSGPLDVFVIDSGINTGRLGTLNSLNN